MSGRFERPYFEDPEFPGGLKGGDEVAGYGYYPNYFPIVEAQLCTLLELTGAATLLDLGCGKGALAEYARRDLDVRAVASDLSAYATRQSRRREGGEWTVRGDSRALPFATASFDAVWCNGMLQYLAADEARVALSEIARVTRIAAFVSNIAAVEYDSVWRHAEEMSRLFLTPRQWALLGGEAGGGMRSVELPFEGESAILMWRPEAASPTLPLRFVELSLQRMRRLGAVARDPADLEAFYERLSSRGRA